MTKKTKRNVIISASSTAVTLTLFFNVSSSISNDRFDITSLITFLLPTSLLYVDTNFEFNVTSVVVIEPVPVLSADEFVANNNVVEA